MTAASKEDKNDELSEKKIDEILEAYNKLPDEQLAKIPQLAKLKSGTLGRHSVNYFVHYGGAAISKKSNDQIQISTRASVDSRIIQ